jgi:hypothetical protein
LHNFQNIVKEELEDVKAMVKILLLKVQKRNTWEVPPASFEVRTTGIEDAMTHKLEPGKQVVAMHDPKCLPVVPI